MVKSSGQGKAPAFSYQVLLIFSYSAFILNMSAAIAAFLTIDRLGDMPKRAKRRFDSGELPPSEVRYDHLLEDFGAGGACLWLRKHCESSAARLWTALSFNRDVASRCLCALCGKLVLVLAGPALHLHAGSQGRLDHDDFRLRHSR